MKQKIFAVFVLLYAICMVVVFGANYYILRYSSTIISPAQLATSTVALVFGGGMNADGSESDMQWDRVRVGVSLYKLGKVQRLMITGDDGRLHSDEVTAMRQQAIDAGVPSSSILVDPHGYRTYESCYREAKVYHLTSAVAVSQTFHLPRIAYLCEKQGLHVEGVPADLREYGYNSFYMEIREIGARVKAWWQAEITKPLPTTLEQ